MSSGSVIKVNFEINGRSQPICSPLLGVSQASCVVIFQRVATPQDHGRAVDCQAQGRSSDVEFYRKRSLIRNGIWLLILGNHTTAMPSRILRPQSPANHSDHLHVFQKAGTFPSRANRYRIHTAGHVRVATASTIFLGAFSRGQVTSLNKAQSA